MSGTKVSLKIIMNEQRVRERTLGHRSLNPCKIRSRTHTDERFHNRGHRNVTDYEYRGDDMMCIELCRVGR